MAARSNALSEITRFWLQECQGLLLRESVPVELLRNNSDIDFIATSPNRKKVTLLGNISFVNAIVETKDERNYDKNGVDFSKRVAHDYDNNLDENYIIPKHAKNVNFSMLREQHNSKAMEIFGGCSFVKIFIFHNLCKTGIETKLDDLKGKGIYFVTSREIIEDIFNNFSKYRKNAGIRNSLVGDIFDLLIDYHKWTPGNLK